MTDADLVLIGQLSGDLEQCHVDGQPQADRIATMLARNPRLFSISFRNCDLSDIGLWQLQWLTGLRSLTVVQTRVTAAGIEAFREIPGCHVVSDFGSFDPRWLPPDRCDS